MDSSRDPGAVIARRWLAVFIGGLVLSGLTAIPLETELGWLVWGLDQLGITAGALRDWFVRVHDGLTTVERDARYLKYGYDWLAFGHLVIALAMVGAWRDPRGNPWLFQFAKIACVMVLPWALVFGAVRGIPLGWRLLDCSFGVGGLVPLWLAERALRTRMDEIADGLA